MVSRIVDRVMEGEVGFETFVLPSQGAGPGGRYRKVAAVGDAVAHQVTL